MVNNAVKEIRGGLYFKLLQFKRRTNSEEHREYIQLRLQVYQREIA